MSGVKNILIGVFVLIAFAVIIFILLFLHPSVGDNGLVLRVRFTDVDKINVGTRVTYAGLPVGEVIGIEEIPDARNNRVNRKGDVYVYQLTLKVDSHVNVYNTDVISIHTSGLLGERNIEINPTPLKPNQELYLVNDEILYAESPANIEDTLKQFGALSSKLSDVLTDVGSVINQLKEEKVVEKISRTAQNIVDITDTLNQPEKLNGTLDNFWKLSERANHTWNTIDHSMQNVYSLTERAHKTWDTVDHAAHNVDHATEKFQGCLVNLDESFINLRKFSITARDLIDNTSQGRGTIGRLFVNDDLYLQLKSILFKGETIANDINSYGLLFHQNKKWQRVNAWRHNLLARLSTPDRFNHYFRNEFDRISTSLARVSMVLNESQCYPQDLLCNQDFAKTFSDLLKKVEGVEESLKMYNEQVVSQDYCQ